MSWLKLDDRLHSHPKIAKAGLAAVGLWTILLSWAGSYATNGIIPREVAVHFAHGDETLVQRLVDARAPGGEAGLLDELPDGTLRLHDFDHYQPSHRRRDTGAARGARGDAAKANAAARWGSAGTASPELAAELGGVLDALAAAGRSMTELAGLAGVSTSTLTRFRRGEVAITADRAACALAALAPLHTRALHDPLHATVHAPPCNADGRATPGGVEACPEVASDQGDAPVSASDQAPHALAVPEQYRADTLDASAAPAAEHVPAHTVARSSNACAVHAPDPVPDPDQRESTPNARARDPGVDPLAVEIQEAILRGVPQDHHQLFDAGVLAETILGTITARHPSRQEAERCMPLVREAIQETARELGSMRAARHTIAARDVTGILTRYVEAKIRNAAKSVGRGEQKTFGFGAGPKKARTGAQYPTTHERPGAVVTPLPPGWEPSEELLVKLAARGFTREIVAEHLDAFRYMERDQQYEDWGAALYRYLETRRSRGAIKIAAEA